MQRKEKIQLSLLAILTILIALFVFSVGPTAMAYDHDQTYNANSTYFVPEDVRASGYCDTKNVEIWMNTSVGATSGLVVLDYESCCANVTSVTINTADWGGFCAYNLLDGQVRISFGVATSNPLGNSGKTKVADLTVHCCNASSCCGTDLIWNTIDSSLSWSDSTGTPQGSIPNVNWADGTFLCGDGVTVTKKVWDGSNWVDAIGPLDSSWVGKDARFNITVTAGCLDLSNVVVSDTMPTTLSYNNNANPVETSNTTHTATWNLAAPLLAHASTSIEFNATIVGYGLEYNTATVTGTVTDLGVEVAASDQASVETMPPAGIEVNKTVWDPAKGEWVEVITSELDFVNIGDLASETGHNLQGWSDNQSGVPYTGGNYGGGDDGTFRLLLGPGDSCGGTGCTDDCRNASFTMTTLGMANKIQLRNLDGSQSDNFTLYIKEADDSLTYIGDYVHATPSEDWVTTTFNFPARTGTITFVLQSTGTITTWCDSYGQVAFSWARLLSDRAKIGETYRFRCEMHNSGSPGMDLSTIEVWDVISPSLQYADNAMIMTPNGVWRTFEPPTSITSNLDGSTTVNWTVDSFLQDPLVLQPCQTFVVEYDVIVVDYGLDCNVQYARGWCENVGQWVYGEDDACIDTPKPDLIVTDITVNYDASGVLDLAIGPELPGTKTQSNNISADITEQNGVDVESPFNVTFYIDSIPKCTVTVPSLAAGDTTTVYCDNSFFPIAGTTYTITVTADSGSDIPETNESNNDLSKDLTAITNGYKGNGWQDGRDISNLQCHEQGTINLTYSTGDSYYLSGYYSKWDNYDVQWIPGDFNIPPTESCIKKARLYAYYHSDQYGDKWSNLSMEFNGNAKTPVAHYSDAKGYGSWDYTSHIGSLVYDVTNEFMVTGPNIANLTNNNPSLPKGITMEGMLLLVVYNNTETEPDRIIWINEGCDLLSSKYAKYGVSREEACTYAPFSGCEPIPMNEVIGAKLITVAQIGNQGDDKNRMCFNDGEWINGLFPSGYYPGTNIGINEADVRPYLNSTNNKATYQDNGDMLAIANAFLVVEKGRAMIEVVAPEDCISLTEQFDVLINVTPMGASVYGVEYELSFDSDKIHAEWQNEGDFLKQDGASTNIYRNTIDNDNGKVSFAVTRTGTSTGVTSPGTLAKIHFTAVQSGTSYLTFTDVDASDPEALPIDIELHHSDVEVCNNTPPVAVAKCLFKYNNVGTKYMSKTYFDGSESNDPDGSLTNYRWYFGGTDYGAGVTYDYIYGSWNWNGASYDPFPAILTVEDNGVPMEDNSHEILVNVYYAGDANGDGEVDIFDGTIIGLEWGHEANFNGDLYWYDNERGDMADLNNDGDVDIYDAVIVGANWGYTAW